MIRPTRRGTAACAGTVAVAAGLSLFAAPASAGTVVTTFTQQCKANSIIGVDKTVPGQTLTVSAPDTVSAGQTFTYRIQTGPSSYPDTESVGTTTNLSRIKFDFAIPANSTFVGAQVVAGTAINIQTTAPGVAPDVRRITTTGSESPTGALLRLSGGNQTANNGPSTSSNSEGGIYVPKSKKNLDGTTNANGATWFQLPAVDVTVVAGSPGVIQPGIRRDATADTYNKPENYYSSLAKATALGGTQWATTNCVPRDSTSAPLNAGAGPLNTINVTAADVATTTTLTAPATATQGQSVTLSAAVAPGTGGTVQFFDGANAIGAPAPVNAGNATLAHTFTTTGAHSVKAVYSGAAGFLGSTSAVQSVNVEAPAPVDVATTTTLTVPATATQGQSVTLSAAVAPGTGGTVQFFDGANAIGAPAPVNAGNATLAHTFTTTGAHSVKAVYSGAAGFLGSTSAVQSVNVEAPAPVDVATTTTLFVPATATQGDSVVLSTTVAPAADGGSVEFFDGATSIGTAPVTAGGATLAHTFTTTGGHSIKAVYGGASGFLGSTSATKSVNVEAPAPTDVATSTSLSAPSTATQGTSVTLSATVSPAEANGTIQFYDNGTAIGAPRSVTSGGASLAHTFTTPGVHSVTAQFTGGTGFLDSTAAAKSVNVSETGTPPTTGGNGSFGG